MAAEHRNLLPEDIVKKIWKVLVGAEHLPRRCFRSCGTTQYPDLPEELTFLHAEEILDMYPDLPRKQRETQFCRSIRQSSSSGLVGR